MEKEDVRRMCGGGGVSLSSPTFIKFLLPQSLTKRCIAVAVLSVTSKGRKIVLSIIIGSQAV